MMRKLIYLILILFMLPVSSYARRFGLSANLLDYAALGTMNLDVSYAVSRHWSLSSGVRYNPFTFREGDPDRQFQYRQQSYALGTRYWLWHTWSGWWFAGKARYQEYNAGGLGKRETEEGDRVGAGLYLGYTHMIAPHLNMEFGVGVWGGMSWYTRYSCPTCGITLEEGQKYFVRPDDFMISVVYVF
jgi:hypothetical protein